MKGRAKELIVSGLLLVFMAVAVLAIWFSAAPVWEKAFATACLFLLVIIRLSAEFADWLSMLSRRIHGN